MAILDDVKLSLRISSTAYNTEITDLVEACKADLSLSGINTTDDTDTLIKRCIMSYVKAYYGYNNPDSDRLKEAYESLKRHLALTESYAFYTLTFTVQEADTTAIREAYIKLWNDELNYEETKSTDASGQATFYLRLKSNYKYDVTATDFISDLHEEDDKNIKDVTADTTQTVTLTGV
jgi:hypothetical protein